MTLTLDFNKYRLRYSVVVSILAHVLILWMFGFLTVKNKAEMKMITDIEFIEPVKPGAPPGPPEEKPKNIWDFMKMALPQIKKPEFPDIKKDEKPVEVVKKEIEKAMELERKLVDKEDPLKKKMNPLEFKNLEKKYDTAMKDLEKLTNVDKKRINDLIEQEKRIVDKGELARTTTADPLQFDEVGRKKVENVREIIAAEKGKEDRIKDLTPADLLTDKKEPVKKNAIVGDDLGIKLKSKEVPDAPFKEIKATKEERKLARELLALQEQLVDKTPAKVASSSGVGGGGGGGRPRIGYGGGGGSITEKKEELKKVDTASVIAKEAKKTSSAVEQNVTAAPKQASVEIAGPLKDRQLMASYMPKYPEWMKEKGMIADVQVLFYVSPSGNVRDNMTIELTSGYNELDKLVMTALKQWQFAPLAKSAAQEDQWGVITMRFRLK